MKRPTLSNLFKTALQITLLLAVSFFSFGTGNAKAASTDTTNTAACGQLLADAEAAFQATLAPDGSVPASPEVKAAATEYIRVSKLCYDEIESKNSTGTLQGEPPSYIDDGGILLSNPSSAEFALTGTKWGSGPQGTSGGMITYSFMGNGISFRTEGYGDSVALTSLPNFQPCFITKIQNAFSAWQAVANVNFVQVTDNGSPFDSPDAVGDIRIGAHTLDGPSRTLAHAYFPPPNGNSAAGDLHFDSAENWSCTSSGTDIGIVALHEIGHSLGLNHEMTNTIAVMDPYYNSSITNLQADDVSGVTAIYGPAAITAAAPVNDNFANAKIIGSIPYTDTSDTTGAANNGDGPPFSSPPNSMFCDGKNLYKGFKNVWYRYTPATTKLVYMDTFGSTPPLGIDDYDTYLAVWTGPDINHLTFVTCDDDDITGLQSQVGFSAQAGVTYYIEAAQYAGDTGGSTLPTPSGGTLQFHATSFQDVGGNYWAWRYIEGLYSAGVTTGCNNNPNLYCPASNVNRDQMAIFLLRGIHGSAYTPPPVGASTGFNDVPIGYWAAAWIKQLAAEGITGGCGGGNYCPTLPVGRDSMAIFLLRAKHGSSYVPPPATGVFQDVPQGSPNAPWIEQLANEGITGGCSVTPKLYCPTNPVTRDQMAIFLDRTFGLPALP